jgi:hypothetical protein
MHALPPQHLLNIPPTTPPSTHIRNQTKPNQHTNKQTKQVQDAGLIFLSKIATSVVSLLSDRPPEVGMSMGMVGLYVCMYVCMYIYT